MLTCKVSIVFAVVGSVLRLVCARLAVTIPVAAEDLKMEDLSIVRVPSTGFEATTLGLDHATPFFILPRHTIVTQLKERKVQTGI